MYGALTMLSRTLLKAAEIIYLDNYFKKHPLEEGGTVADSEINLPLAKT